MSRRHTPTIKVDKQSRSVLQSLEIPNTFSSRDQSRTNNASRRSDRDCCPQKESPKSETLSIACSYQELFCTTDSCTNSQNCLKAFPEVCPHGLKKDNDGHCSTICHEIHNASNNPASQQPIKSCGNSTSSIRIATIKDSPSCAGLCSSCHNSQRSNSIIKSHSCTKTQNAKRKQSDRNSVEFAPVTQSRRAQIASSPIHDPEQQLGNGVSASKKHASCCQEINSPSQGSTASDSYIPEKCFKDTGSQTDERITLFPICRPKAEQNVSEQNAPNTKLVDKNMSCCAESEALMQKRENEFHQEDTEKFEQSFVDTGTHVTPETKTAGTGTSKSTKKDSSKTKVVNEELTDSSPRRSLTKEECMDCCAKQESTRSRPNLQSSVRIPEATETTETNLKDSCCAKEEISQVIDTKNDPSSCLESVVESPVQKKCSCHFPPAFKQFGCTGNIAGNCNCASSN